SSRRRRLHGRRCSASPSRSRRRRALDRSETATSRDLVPGRGRKRGLPRLREAEVDLARGGVGPAAGDDLPARVEVDALGTVDVAVAEERGLPAAEAVVGDGDGDRDVDADHAGLDVELELAGDAAVAGEDRGAVAVGTLVDE